jgi:hypothetical protein
LREPLRLSGGLLAITSALTSRLSDMEAALRAADAASVRATLDRFAVDGELATAARLLKAAAGQINVIVHAVGILLALPHILEPGETIQHVSLGAGNTGRLFDLETSHRIAEFKFIQWRGDKRFGRTRCSKTSTCSPTSHV